MFQRKQSGLYSCTATIRSPSVVKSVSGESNISTGMLPLLQFHLVVITKVTLHENHVEGNRNYVGEVLSSIRCPFSFLWYLWYIISPIHQLALKNCLPCKEKECDYASHHSQYHECPPPPPLHFYSKLFMGEWTRYMLTMTKTKHLYIQWGVCSRNTVRVTLYLVYVCVLHVPCGLHNASLSYGHLPLQYKCLLHPLDNKLINGKRELHHTAVCYAAFVAGNTSYSKWQ